MHDDRNPGNEQEPLPEEVGAPRGPSSQQPILLRKAMPGSVRFSRRGLVTVLAAIAFVGTAGAWAFMNQHPSAATLPPTPVTTPMIHTSSERVSNLDANATNVPTLPGEEGRLPPTSAPGVQGRTAGTTGSPQHVADLLDQATRDTQSTQFDTSSATIPPGTFGHVDVKPGGQVPSIGGGGTIPMLTPQQRAAQQRAEQQAALAQQAVSSPLKVGGNGVDAIPAVHPAVQTPSPQPVAQSGNGVIAASAGPENNMMFASSQDTRDEYLHASPQSARGAFEIWSGTAIPAILDTGINADLPGPVFAHIAQNVYDSKTGSILLIPKGATLRGRYNTVISVGQNRVEVVWEILRWPNGQWMQLESMPSADMQGEAGIPANANDHRGRIITTTLLTAILSAAPQLAQPQTVTPFGVVTQTAGQTLASSAATQIANTGSQLVQKTMQQPPTLTVPRGTAFTVLLDRSVVLNPYGDGH